MIDTHCHLSFSQFHGDRDVVRERAGIAGVKAIINPGTDLEQSRAAVALASSTSGVSPSTPEVFAAVGVHPQDVAGLTEDDFIALAELAHHPRVVAIGEVGLELSSRAAELALQKEWLERFMDLALGVEKPLIFHVRNAHQEFRAFLERAWAPASPLDRARSTELRAPRAESRGELGVERRSTAGAGRTPLRRSGFAGQGGVVHCFSGTLDDARWYTARGLFLGVTGIVTFPSAAELTQVVEGTPLERLVLETDAPFLAPQSHRGKRNEPAYLPEIAEKIARVKNVSVEEVERVTDDSARRLFRLS